MYILGMDIGYSNLKGTAGFKGEKMKTFTRPVGAGPARLMPEQIMGSATADAIYVSIDGEQWVAGVEPDRLQGWDRELHKDYPATKAYKALFYTALLLSEQTTIDCLVTGLPVEEYMAQGTKEALIDSLKGEHQVTPKRVITVKDVLVLPQPAGAYMEMIQNTDDQSVLNAITEGRTVVIDPGFYSVDWVCLEEGEIRYHSSGTSLKAMSMVIQEMNGLITRDHGGGPGMAKIEKAIRAGKESILLYGEAVHLAPYFEAASKSVAANALTPMKQSMREEGMAADVVLITGGGATAYKEAAKELFPRSKIVLSDDSVTAVARGFWFSA